MNESLSSAARIRSLQVIADSRSGSSESSKATMRLPPIAFARRIASSAQPSASGMSAGPSARPMTPPEAPTGTGLPAGSNRWPPSICSTSSPIARARSTETSVRTTAN